MIHKEGTDQSEIQNYTPILLLNVDYEIFASILANRLKKVLVQIIHQDQSGFLPKRQMKNNIRIVLNVLEYYEAHPEKQMALIFFDAEKAFDNMNWNFLLTQLQLMEAGDKFIGEIKAIYSKQEASIKVNRQLTETIHIEKGTREGCPLSSLLFILILEFLNQQIREDKRIKGLKVKG